MKKNWLVFKARFIMSAKLYFRYPVNIMMTLFEPIMWITPIYFMGKSFSSNGKLPGFEGYVGNSDFIGFLVIGYMVSCYVATVFWTIGFSIKTEMTQGVLESNWSAPVNRIVMVLSRGTFQFCAATFEVILTGIVCHFAFGFNINNEVLKAIIFLIPGIIGMLGLGLAVASLVLLAREANAIIDLTNAILSALSGSYFPIKVMPKAFVFIAMVLPLTYIYDSTRGILINQNTIFSLGTEFLIILATMVGFLAMGAFVFNKVEKKCRALGILGTH